MEFSPRDVLAPTLRRRPVSEDGPSPKQKAITSRAPPATGQTFASCRNPWPKRCSAKISKCSIKYVISQPVDFHPGMTVYLRIRANPGKKRKLLKHHIHRKISRFPPPRGFVNPLSCGLNYEYSSAAMFGSPCFQVRLPQLTFIYGASVNRLRSRGLRFFASAKRMSKHDGA